MLLTVAVLSWVHAQPAQATKAAKANAPNEGFWRTVFQRSEAGAASEEVDAATSKKVKLGQRLFNDTRLSGDRDMSCETCHDRALAFTDGMAQARGRNNTQLQRNTPSLYNLASSTQFNWDASASSLETQAIRPITHPNEMNGSFDTIANRLHEDPNTLQSFSDAFGSEDISKDRVLDALATYVRSLVSPRTRFDEWVEGDADALGPTEKKGFKLFVGKAGCVSCHSGWRFTDDTLHDIGVVSDDPGNSAIVGGHPQIPSFKTPGLRELSKTAPYMHNGSIQTLEEVINHYTDGFIDRPSLSSSMRRDLDLTSAEKSALVDFLLSLSSAE